jgi:hypothetical protein
MIHLDVWTTKTKSIGGCKYYVNFIDDHIEGVDLLDETRR